MNDCLRLKKSNCKNCYKCIRHCPVKSIRFSGNQAHIVKDECILCGQCFAVCPQNAKEIVSELEKVKTYLMSGETVCASIAPSFAANYENVSIESMRSALSELGFAHVYETAQGAAAVKKEYERLLNEEKRDILISSCCHSVNLLIQKYYPSALPFLADVLSPMQAHCKMLRSKYGENIKIVFIGPCVAKKDESAHYAGFADAVLTFEELTAWLDDSDIALPRGREHDSGMLTGLFPTAGGITDTMYNRPADYTYITVDGAENCIAALKDIEAGNIHKCFIEMSICEGSCIGGPVMENRSRAPIRNYAAIRTYSGSKDCVLPDMHCAELRKGIDFIGSSGDMPDEMDITSVLRKMGKNKPSDELNCGSCGYNSCRDKAIAILRGKADLTMCLPYLKDKAESFSDSIVSNTPNGLIVLNESLEVQRINSAARKILNIRAADDIMGDRIVRVLDPKPFMDVLQSGQAVRDKRVYLAEYDRFVEQTIVRDNDFMLIICILRDVTEEETERRKKESICIKTAEIADKVVDKQMRIVQEIASLLGETAAETKIALYKLKESVSDE